MGLAGVIGAIGRAARSAWRGTIHGPVTLAKWIIANPSHAIAAVWLGGVATFTTVNGRRAYREYRREAALRLAEEEAAPKERDRPPEVVEMLDVDEINNMRTERMHANGLGAAGEGDVVTDKTTIEAAQASRARVAIVEGERVGASGDVVVVTKGGIAGWMSRNKDKKADPETLAWLRGEEVKDGRAAYASWANGDNSIAGWLARGKAREGTPLAGSGSDAKGSVPTNSTYGSQAPEIMKAREPDPTIVKPPPHFDLASLGMAARAAIVPKHARAAVAELPEPTTAEIDGLRARLPATGDAARLEIVVRNRHVVIAIPGMLLFGPGSSELTSAGKALVRQLAGVLGTVEHRDIQLVAADGDRAMEVAGTLVVAGIDADRLSLAAATDRGKDAIDIVLIAGSR